jgi:arginine-tRNA-protein transferase
VKRRGDAAIAIEVISPQVDDARIRLFNKHRSQRGMARRDGDIDAAGYAAFLSESCGETLEVDYRLDGRLIGAAICDRGATCLSAVYCYFDPDYERLSPGVYSVLTLIELCRRWDLVHLYLGYYIAASAHMSYKAVYRPHERLIDGQWRQFE